MPTPFPLYALFIAASWLQGDDGTPGESAHDPPSHRALIDQHCSSCHGGRRTKADLDLVAMLARADRQGDRERDRDAWLKAAARIRAGDMPPPGRPEILDDARADAARSIEEWLPGVTPSSSRRLTRAEIDHSLDDLLGFGTDIALATLPQDGAGGAGFDTCADTLFLSPLFLDGWLLAAREVAALAVPNEIDAAEGFSADQQQLYARWLSDLPAVADGSPDNDRKIEAATSLIADELARRVWRRTPSEDDVASLLHRFQLSLARNNDVRQATREMVVFALVSPKFLYRVDDASDRRRATDATIAERLAFFLTAGPPDEALLSIAAAGTLVSPDILHDQADRLIDGASARRFAERFVVQWLEIESLLQPPGGGASRIGNAALKRSMVDEPVEAFLAALREDRAVFDLVSSDTVFLDEALARHYGLALPPGSDDAGGAYREVDGQGVRGGVLASAAVLTATSLTTRTSPTVRGRFILDRVLGQPPPPPPPDAGSLPPVEAGVSLPVRERLERHRRDPACTSCHAAMDPLGFALEGYDPLGRRRELADGLPVDDRFRLIDGSEGQGLADLKVALSGRRDAIERHLARLLIAYAVGADPGTGYGPDVEDALERAREPSGAPLRLRRLVHAILDGPAFLDTRPAPEPEGEPR